MDRDDVGPGTDLHYRCALLRATLEMCSVYLELGWSSDADQETLKRRVDAALEATGGSEGSDY